jgi:hypothetical protein
MPIPTPAGCPRRPPACRLGQDDLPAPAGNDAVGQVRMLIGSGLYGTGGGMAEPHPTPDEALAG